MKLTEKSSEVFNYVKENGGRVSVEEICKATSRESRSINANVNDLVKKGLAERDKVTVEGVDKPVTYVVLTEDGKAFAPTEDAE